MGIRSPLELLQSKETILVLFVLIMLFGNQSIICTPSSFGASSIETHLKSSQQDPIVNSSNSVDEHRNSSSISSGSRVSDSSDNKITLPHLIDRNLTVQVVAQGLNMPTNMAFLGKDDFLILQKNGTLVRVVDGKLSNKTRLDVPVSKGFYQGLLGIAITRSTPTNRTFVFLYYTEVSPNNTTNSYELKPHTSILGNRVYRYELKDDKLIDPKLLLNLPANAQENNGGYITIGPDNNLYILVGEVNDEWNETGHQTLTLNFVNSTIVDGRAGILRITLDGRPVLDDKGHGILGDTFPLNLYYAYGIHNGFGMDFDPVTRILWDTEPGHWINDEINIVRPGFNSGYGIIQGLSIYFPAAPFALVNFHGKGKYNDPEFVWTHKVVPTGLKFLTSEKLGSQYHNDMFVGGFLDGRLYHFHLTKDRSHLLLPSELSSKILQNWNSTGYKDIVFGTGFGGISSLSVGPDGFLYVVSVMHGKVYRIVPKNEVIHNTS
jgi:aldose sugar dehydrogenase